MYALNLNKENRILSACFVLKNGNYKDMPIVDALPQGNIADYLYIDGEFVYSPLPIDEAAEKAQYEAMVSTFIREKYSVDDELAILRQRDTKPEEFAEYNAYAEDCKARAKAK